MIYYWISIIWLNVWIKILIKISYQNCDSNITTNNWSSISNQTSWYVLYYQIFDWILRSKFWLRNLTKYLIQILQLIFDPTYPIIIIDTLLDIRYLIDCLDQIFDRHIQSKLCFIYYNQIFDWTYPIKIFDKLLAIKYLVQHLDQNFDWIFQPNIWSRHYN